MPSSDFNLCIFRRVYLPSFFSTVPSSPPLIRSEHGKILDKVSEPVQEGSTLTLICETQGGEPLPRLTWKRGQVILDDVIEEVDTQNRVVRNYLKMPSLHRRDHGDVLSCLASNTNLSAPEITYININMVCKWKKNPVIFTLVSQETFRNSSSSLFYFGCFFAWQKFKTRAGREEAESRRVRHFFFCT